MWELIESIRAGNRQRLSELYEQNRGLLHTIARRYLGVDRAADMDDLMQAGFLGLLAAVDAWEPDRGAWSTCATFHIRKAMQDAAGLAGSRKRAHLGAVSLDEPIPGGDDEGASRLDALADESLPEPDEDLFQGEIARTVRSAVATIPDAMQAEVIRLHRLEGAPLATVGQRLGCSIEECRRLDRSGLNVLRRDKGLNLLMRAYFLDQNTNFYAHKGLDTYLSDWTSTTEAAALWRAEQQQKWSEA